VALPAFLIPLLAKGLHLIGNAALVKGKKWVKEKTGVDLDEDSLTSEDYVKLKQYEMEHEEELIKLQQEDDKLELEETKVFLEDMQSARQMQMSALGQSDMFSKRFVYYLAMFWSLATVAYIGFITFSSIPEENVRFADTILGFLLGTIVAQILNYFYGSSRSSHNKDETFKQVIKDVTRR